MKISFCMIVFNIEKALPNKLFEYCVENIYSFAHEILVVEGATQADGVNHPLDGITCDFTKNGQSTDNTMKIIKNINDPQNKIKIITKNGFWNGKTEMCNAYAKIATGDYIWQIDSDEFYHKNDMLKIIEILKINNPFAVHFYANHFFGNYEYVLDEQNDLVWSNRIPWMRIFKHIPNKSKWISHEPPNYMCNNIICNNQKNILTRDDTLKMGIKLFHYSLVCEKQIDFKSKFFRNENYRIFYDKWKLNKKTPLFNGCVCKFFDKQHPEIIEKLIKEE